MFNYWQYREETQAKLAQLNGALTRYAQECEALRVVITYHENAIEQRTREVTADVTGETGSDGKTRYSNDMARKAEISKRVASFCQEHVAVRDNVEAELAATEIEIDAAKRQRQDTLAILALTTGMTQIRSDEV